MSLKQHGNVSQPKCGKGIAVNKGHNMMKQKLPGKDFVYGISTSRKGGGVPEAMFWQEYIPRFGSDQPIRTDLVSLNRDGVHAGLSTAKELNLHRAQFRDQYICQKPVKPVKPTPWSQDRTYGLKMRPSSPLADILAHKYGQLWLEKHRTSPQPLPQKKPVADTRTSLLRKGRPLPHYAPMFKMSRFNKVPAALDTFRDPAEGLRARQAALARTPALTQE